MVVEFKRSGRGVHRVIELSHHPNVLPPQLAARGVSPQLWAALMADVNALAASHPYAAKPSGGQVAKWAGCFCLLSVIGFGVVQPDAGDWNLWLGQAEQVVARHQAAFSQQGVALSVARAQGSYWIQADCCAPVVAAVPGVPVPVKAV